MGHDLFHEDVFIVPYLDGAILYVPRYQIVVAVESRVQELVNRLRKGLPVQTTPLAAQWIDILRKIDELQKSRDAQVCEFDEPYFPTDITLSLTTKCSLRCVYCYARAGEEMRDLSRPIAERALSLAAKNASESGRKHFGVNLHGEGEPTFNWSLFTWVVERAEELADQHGIDVELSMSTNAIWGSVQRDFVSQHFRRLSVSLDGKRPVQNTLRPTQNGTGSFDTVMRSLAFLTKAGVSYRIRATVTPMSVSEMVPFVKFIASETAADSVSLEPVYANGRGADIEIDGPSFYDYFAREYELAQHIAAEKGLQISYSGCQVGKVSRHFCRATGPEPNFTVMTNGVVSSCYEICDPESSKGKFTVYGKWDPDRRDFNIDKIRLDRLRRFDVAKISRCRDCFAHWNCGGDCLARNDGIIEHDSKETLPPRCVLNRSMTLNELVKTAAVLDTADEV